jgi:predicted TIM-barrel fold metal-dependent hydrolase
VQRRRTGLPARRSQQRRAPVNRIMAAGKSLQSTVHKRRRRLLFAAGAAGLGGAGAWRYWPEQGIVNPCLDVLPPHLATHELVQAAWESVDPAKVWDCHAHLLGSGDSGSGIWINPAMQSVLHPLQYAQRLFYLNAACAHAAHGRVDQNFVERMGTLLAAMRRGAKLMLLAFDYAHRADGTPAPAATTFYTPNDYAWRTAQTFPQQFEWAASIHPYRVDAVATLEEAKRGGARAVKWLPAAMGIDPAAPRCDAFYAALARLDMPLLTHAGRELAVAAEFQEFGNPLKLRRALDHGVRVVVAHCASLGQDRDLDRGANGPLTDSFLLFARLMDDARHAGRVFGDLSAMTQLNRAGPALARVIERSEWHARLLNGSDYPLPGIMPLYSVAHMVELKFIEPAMAPVLSAIRRHNPLLFDFVLKRHLTVGGKRLAAGVFETKPFFSP